MKNLFITLLLLTITPSLCASSLIDDSHASEMPQETALRLVCQLADYGYECQSALSLIDAAQILIDNPMLSLDEVPYLTDSANVILGPAKILNIERLLLDARMLANDSEELLKLVEKLCALRKTPESANSSPTSQMAILIW